MVVSPGSGGMAKAKEHDTILYVIYTVIYISKDIYIYMYTYLYLYLSFSVNIYTHKYCIYTIYHMYTSN